MKRRITQMTLLIVFMSVSITSFAQEARRTMDPVYTADKKDFSWKPTKANMQLIINHFDMLIMHLEEVQPHDYKAFWSAVEKHSPEYITFRREKHKKSVQEYCESFYYQFHSMEFLYEDLPIYSPDEQGISSLTEEFQSKKKAIKNIYTTERLDNVCVNPEGSVLMDKKFTDMLTDEELRGIVAHETAHFMLEHHVAGEVNKIKVQKKAENRARFGAVLNTLAANLDNNFEHRTYAESVLNLAVADAMNDALMRRASLIAQARSIHYNKSQEIEADLVACLFCRFEGIPIKSLKKGLAKVSVRADYKVDDNNDHPNATFRYTLMDFFDDYQKVIDARRVVYEKAKQFIPDKSFAEFMYDMIYISFYNKKIYNKLHKDGLIDYPYKEFQRSLNL